MSQNAQWSHHLSHARLPSLPGDPPNTDDYMVNSAVISDDGSCVVGGTYYYPYSGTKRTHTDGTFGVYCYTSGGHRLWADEFEGDEGVYAVALSGDGHIAVAGGLFTGGLYSTRADQGLLRVYDVTTGNRLLDYVAPQFTKRVNCVSISGDGAVLSAAMKTSLGIFLRNQQTYSPRPLTPFATTKTIESVAVHPGGGWFAGCGEDGNVYVANIKNQTVDQPVLWTEPEHTHFITAAVSKGTDYFVVGGAGVVYLFDRSAMGHGPIAQYSLPQGGPKSIRSVWISKDGMLVTAVANQGPAGMLLGLAAKGKNLTLAWQWPTVHNPNSTTMDDSASYITVAEGYPDDKPGSFSLFNAGGKLWEHATAKMSWPMMISANGKGIVAGSDDNILYYFAP